MEAKCSSFSVQCGRNEIRVCVEDLGSLKFQRPANNTPTARALTTTCKKTYNRQLHRLIVVHSLWDVVMLQQKTPQDVEKRTRCQGCSGTELLKKEVCIQGRSHCSEELMGREQGRGRTRCFGHVQQTCEGDRRSMAEHRRCTAGS